MLYTDGTYLVADTPRELDEFARRINLPQKFRHSTSFAPLCRLPSPYDQQAVEAGAKLLDIPALHQLVREIAI
ncbi:MAG: hypothetical protein AAF944_26330 [Bacteroidota bacterium]